MTGGSRIEPEDFVERVRPLLVHRDVPGLAALLRRHWTSDQICHLLARGDADADARKVAALALSLVGERDCIPPLAEQLRNPDPVINSMAEHALWSIWFRLGTPEANHQLARGTLALNRRDYDHALGHFTRAIEIDPDFAEAYNQRALVAYLQERYEDSIADALKVVDLMPSHFGAWAGMGHAYANVGDMKAAGHAYRQALRINPHLGCVREALDALDRRV